MADTVGPSGEQQTVFQASPLKVLVNMLANTLGSPVVDKTGLDGLYDYTFEWPDAGSSLFASVDQLGLKLEAKKEPVEVLVMDRAEHPSANYVPPWSQWRGLTTRAWRLYCGGNFLALEFELFDLRSVRFESLDMAFWPSMRIRTKFSVFKTFCVMPAGGLSTS